MSVFKQILLSLLLTAVACVASAVEWQNLDDDHYLGGRRCSAGYLTGKVVLVCRDPALAPRMEEVWTSFKTKPFVLLGVFEKAPNDASYPVYSKAKLAAGSPETPFFIVDATGKIRYRGADERRATELVVTFLTDIEAPKSEAQWRQFLDYELEALPGHAYLRYQDFKKKFPASAKEYADKYAELLKVPNVKKLSELVHFAKGVKDLRAVNPKKARLVKSRLSGKIDDALKKYSSLKESDNPLVVQEAKNALADLAWAKAAL